MTINLSVLNQVYANIRDFYRQCYWQSSTQLHTDSNGYVLCYTGKPSLMGANQLWIDDEDALNHHTIARAHAFFRPLRAAWSIFMMPQLMPHAMDFCQKIGASLRWKNPIMSHNSVPSFSPSASVENYALVPVEDFMMRHRAQDLMAQAFDFDPSIAQLIIRADHEWTASTIKHFIIALDGQQAGTISLNGVEGVAGVWNVGVLPRFRGVGAASFGVQQVCQLATQRGSEQTILLSSIQAFSLYQRLGFQVVADACYLTFDF